MAKIYTKTGDSGTTGLVGGTRVAKSTKLMHAIGTADELSAHLGVVPSLLYLPPSDDMVQALWRLQQELFEIGARLAGSDTTPIPGVAWMEEAIDWASEQLSPLRNFILPGGCAPGGQLHLARAVCRRFERCLNEVCGGSAPEALPIDLLVWANRASDLLFVMARYTNMRAGQIEMIWKG